MILCLTGMPGSGKSTAAEIFAKMGFEVIEGSAIIKEEMRRKGIRVTPESVEVFANRVKSERGKAAFAIMTIFYVARTWAHRTTLSVFGLISRPLGEKLAGIAERLADGLHFLGRPRDALPFLLETSAYWGINVLGMWFLAWACGLVHADGTPATLGESCAMMGMLGVTILIPGTPGLLGVFQLGIYAGMTMYYPLEVVTGPGAAYVSLLYGVQVACTVVLGAAGFLIERGSLKALEVAEESMEEDEAKA